MTTITVFGLCLTLLSLKAGVISQLPQSCRTPDGLPGRCIPLRDCSPLYKMMLHVIRNENLQYKEAVDSQLKRSQCGEEDDEGPFHPLMCCPVPKDPPDVSTHTNIHRINHPNCGREEHDRVVHGEAVSLLQFRWMALLAYRMDDGSIRFRCGGTLINERYVLTAAHCLEDKKDLVFVRLGEYDTSRLMDCENTDDEEERLCLNDYLDLHVERKIRHPNYTSTAQGSDVGLIRLNQSVALNTQSINAICLPVQRHQKSIEGSIMTITGWGITEQNQASSVLRKADVPVQRKDECGAIYKSMFNYTIDETMICAGDHRDSCKGDSGGPLQMKHGNSMYQYGIVSYGPKVCGTVGVPGVYTNVKFYLNWILDQMT